MKIKIENRCASACIYETEVADDDGQPMRTAVERAVASGTHLFGADLVGADLSSARLSSACLNGADLEGASLVGANLEGANLDRARLDGASLDGANLSGASLDGASLSGARLDGANLDRARLDGASLDGARLVGANLDGANLSGANLDRASLDPIKADLRLILDAAAAEVPQLLAALRAGRIDGAAYRGECACLFGTIANTRGCDIRALGARMTPDTQRPAERWFLAIRPGGTPQTNPVAAITERWIVEWQADRAAAIKPYADLLRSLRSAAAPEIAAKIDALIGGAA